MSDARARLLLRRRLLLERRIVGVAGGAVGVEGVGVQALRGRRRERRGGPGLARKSLPNAAASAGRERQRPRGARTRVLFVAEGMQDGEIELVRVLQKREVAGVGQDQRPSVRKVAAIYSVCGRLIASS